MTVQASERQPGDHVQVTGYEGIAFWWLGSDDGLSTVIMVGDDFRHIVEDIDITDIDADGFCESCGQVGCGW